MIQSKTDGQHHYKIHRKYKFAIVQYLNTSFHELIFQIILKCLDSIKSQYNALLKGTNGLIKYHFGILAINIDWYFLCNLSSLTKRSLDDFSFYHSQLADTPIKFFDHDYTTPGGHLLEKMTGFRTLFRSHFSKFLLALSRFFSFFGPFLSFFPFLVWSQFFPFVLWVIISLRAIKMRCYVQSSVQSYVDSR